MLNIAQKYLKGDRVIWVVIILLSLFSVIMAYSASSNMAYRLNDGDATSYLMKHAIILLVSFCAIVYVHNVNYSFFSRLAQLGVWAAAALLLVTLLFGTNVNSASRWLLGFQPSDLAKIVLIVYVGRMLSIKKDIIHDFKQGLLPILIPIGVICFLILPADFSTALLLFASCFVLLFIGGALLKHLMAVVGGFVVFFLLLIAINSLSPGLLPRVNTWQERVADFWSGEDEENYQAHMAKMGIAKGGIANFNPGGGDIKKDQYSSQSDYMYSTIIEEFGFFPGAIVPLMLYLIFFFRSLRITVKSENKFGSYIVFGLSFMLVLQALVNMGVGSTLLPVTGQPLPLVSMGGTSILFTCISIGIILSVSKHVYPDSNLNTANG